MLHRPPQCQPAVSQSEDSARFRPRPLHSLSYHKGMKPMLGLAAAILSSLHASDLVKEGDQWWSHVQVLADDKMEGRNTGSPGHKRAADYMAAQFERAGLKPAGT